MLPRYVNALALACVLLSGCAGTASLQHAGTAATRDEPPAAAAVEDVDAAFAAALQLMQAGDWHAAADRLSAITAVSPQASGAWTNLGITQVKLGDAAAARSAFRSAIDSDRRQIEAWNQLGMLQRRAGELEAAGASWRSALEINPDFANAHWNLAILYDRYLPDPARALAHYTQYRQLTQSDDPQLQQWIAALEEQLPETVKLTAGVNK